MSDTDSNTDTNTTGESNYRWWQIGNRYQARKPRHPSTQGGGFGAKIGDAIAGTITTVLLGTVLMVTRVIPGTWKMWRGFLKAGYRGIYRSTSADYIGHINVGGKIKHVPVEFDHEENKIKTLADEDPEWWYVAAEGDNTYSTIGNVPAVWASARANEVGSHVQAEVAEVLDLGGGQWLAESADVDAEIVVDAQGGQQGAGTAVADGGVAAQNLELQVTGAEPGFLRDEVVDLRHEDDARVISMDKYYETYPEKADPKEMQNQRDMGRLMEADSDLSAYAMKMLLIAGAIVVLSLAAVFVLPELLGGGGSGGGGGIIPIVIGLGGFL